MTTALRDRLGAKWSVVLLLLPPSAFGVFHFGPRAAAVLGLSVGLCLVANVLPRALRGDPFRWVNSGSVVTGLLLGLTLTADVPLYMIVVGALVAEIPGKAGRNSFNPAALGRAAIAVVETLDPPAYADGATGASVLFKDAGGHLPPALVDAFLGTTTGAIGETSALVLALVCVPMLAFVAVKREAAVSMLVLVPVLVATLPASAAIAGHAPWVLDPAYFLLGSAALLNATFFCTDPSTTPNSRFGGIVFGIGAGTLGVLGRLYTEIPGAEMYGILVMNALTPALDAAGRRLTAGRPRPGPPPDFYERPDRGRPGTIARGFGLGLMSRPSPYAAVSRALDDPAGALEAVRRAGVGGCGGAGFKAASKWDAALRHAGPRVLIINAQEGEQDTLKDRYLLEHYPERVVAGAAVAALCLGAEEVHLVYDPAFPRGAEAVREAWSGLPEDQDLPPLTLHAGPGLYVCGEETALIAFLEGGLCKPTPRPPYPTERGLRGRPTVVHNVETLAWISHAAAPGGGAAQAGTHRLVTLLGPVRRPGVYEVPLGMTLAGVVELGGGLTPGARLGAYAVGGPSGGLLPPSCGEVPLAADALARVGARLGTASLEVIGDDRCVVRAALDSACFMRDASCGRCTPCRVGTEELARLWGEIARGRSNDEAGLALVRCALKGSICGLGTAAATRVESVLRHWPEVVQAHASDGSCDECQTSS